MFWAEKNNGAYLNDRRLRVSGRKNLFEGVLATGIPFGIHRDKPVNEKFIAQLQGVMGHLAGVRRFGSAALDLAYVAAGRYDGYWENGLHPWDVAAGVVIVREAGGFVTETKGRRYELGAPDILATNDGLHEPLLKLFAAPSNKG